MFWNKLLANWKTSSMWERVCLCLQRGGGLLLDGSASLRDLVTQLRWNFPRAYGVETLAGFLLARFGYIPAEGDHLEFDGRRFAVTRMEDKRIAQVRVDPVS